MAWNGSGGASAPIGSKASAKKPSPWRGLVAGAVVVALAAVGAYVLLCKSGSLISNDESVEERRIKEQKPAKMRKESASAGLTASKIKVDSDATVAKTHEIQADDASESVASNTETQVEKEKPKDNRLFKNPMDQLLSMVMPKQPGATVPPLPDIGSLTFTPEEEDRLLERLAESEDDSEETLDRKEIVQSLRDEYHELKATRKWSFVDYVKALDAKVRLDAEVLSESIKLHQTVFNDRTISDEEYTQALEKINKVLSARGITPIGLQNDDDDAPESDDAN